MTLFWDLNGRNHEITILKLKHIRFREKYAEGEVPHEAKTGSGPILLTTSFPYVRDWINEHPFRSMNLRISLYNQIIFRWKSQTENIDSIHKFKFFNLNTIYIFLLLVIPDVVSYL